MRWSSSRSLLLAAGALAASALAWAASGAAAPARSAQARIGARSADVVLAWGDGPAQVALRPTRLEQPADGVSAVAVGPAGDVWLLDKLHARVLHFDPLSDPAPVEAARVPADAEDIAIGPQGTVAVHSLLRSRVFLYASGAPAGELPIPRTLRELVGFSLGPSHQVLVTNAYQETLRIGSPAVPQATESVLHSRREGAVILPDGSGLTVRLDRDRSAELLWNRFGDGRNHVVARHRVSGPVLSAHIVGASAGAACLSLEHGQQGPGFVVGREIVCVDAATGAERLKAPLRDAPLYLPQRYAAVGGDPPRLALIEPTRDGLHVALREIPASRTEVQP